MAKISITEPKTDFVDVFDAVSLSRVLNCLVSFRAYKFAASASNSSAAILFMYIMAPHNTANSARLNRNEANSLVCVGAKINKSPAVSGATYHIGTNRNNLACVSNATRQNTVSAAECLRTTRWLMVKDQTTPRTLKVHSFLQKFAKRKNRNRLTGCPV